MFRLQVFMFIVSCSWTLYWCMQLRNNRRDAKARIEKKRETFRDNHVWTPPYCIPGHMFETPWWSRSYARDKRDKNTQLNAHKHYTRGVREAETYGWED